MTTIVRGFLYLVDGFRLITKPGLKRYVLLPLLINAALFVGLFFLTAHLIEQFNHWFTNYLPTWLHWLGMLIWPLFLLSYLLFFIYAFVTLANLVAAPFNSLLAEKVELYLTQAMPESRGLFASIKDVPRIVGRQISIVGYYVPRALFIVLVFFIPLTQPVAALIWLMFNAWYLALTYIDYPTDNHRVSLIQARLWLQERRWIALGFGFGTMFFSMIPGVNLVVVPAAVAGAVKCWVVENKMRNNQ